jgi:hypothetical protein
MFHEVMDGMAGNITMERKGDGKRKEMKRV